MTDNALLKEIEHKLNVHEMNRFVGNDEVVIFGKRDNQDNEFYFFNNVTKTLSNGKWSYYVDKGAIKKLSVNDISSLRDTLLPKFAQKYGFAYGGNGDKTAYVLADTTCPFSEQFFAQGGADKLIKSGYKVIVIPMSRKVKEDELIGLSVFNCALNKGDKKKIFMDAIKKKTPLGFPATKTAEHCDYWGDLKPLYSVFEEYNLRGFPAIFKSDSSKVEYGV
ncbi:hypothetical protein [Photobacterium damselae]|uniref:hypothetical protein n=1 Tax=Photobacterium damselae TaxID=38293 RepID=UPI004068849E